MFFSSSNSSGGGGGSRSSSNRKTKAFRLEDIDEEWRTDTTPITNVKLLARGLGGINTGAVHTALLFKTNPGYFVIEYGDCGMRGNFYMNSQKMQSFANIMGCQNYVSVYDITACFEDIHLSNRLQLKLNDVYFQIDKLRNFYTLNTYSYLDRNCRHFARELCGRLGCNEKGLEFLSSFLLNLPIAARSIVNLLTMGSTNKLRENKRLQNEYLVGYWNLREKIFMAKQTEKDLHGIF